MSISTESRIVVNPPVVRGRFPVAVRWEDRPDGPIVFETGSSLASYIEHFAPSAAEDDGPSFVDGDGRLLIVRIDRCALNLLAVDGPNPRKWIWFETESGGPCAVEFMGEHAIRALVSKSRNAGRRWLHRGRGRAEFAACPSDWAVAVELTVRRTIDATQFGERDLGQVWDLAIGNVW